MGVPHLFTLFFSFQAPPKIKDEIPQILKRTLREKGPEKLRRKYLFHENVDLIKQTSWTQFPPISVQFSVKLFQTGNTCTSF